MQFHTLVGILPHEQQFPQPLEVDITVWLEARTGGESPVGLDYRELHDAVTAAVEARAIGYLEELVERTAESLLALRSVSRVRVAARKPHVALPGPLAHAEVVFEQDRDA